MAKVKNNRVVPKEVKLHKARIKAQAIVIAIIPVIIYLILVNVMIMIGFVPTNSMSPTIKADDVAIYNRLAYKSRDVEYGDVIVFFNDEEHTYLTKRVIAKGGDSIESVNGKVILNGKELEESYLPEDTITKDLPLQEVPEGCYFVLGDNRSNSKDSRYLIKPYIQEEEISGKAWIKFQYKDGLKIQVIR